jgi:hypothetical protein
LRVWLHLKPGAFKRLPTERLQRYADVFDISVRELQTLPATHRSRSHDD